MMQIEERTPNADHVVRATDVVSIDGEAYVVSTVVVDEEYRAASAGVGLTIPLECTYESVIIHLDTLFPMLMRHTATDVEADSTHQELVMAALTETFTETE